MYKKVDYNHNELIFCSLLNFTIFYTVKYEDSTLKLNKNTNANSKSIPH